MSDKSIELVLARDDDYECSYQVKKAAEGELIHKIFGWNETSQREFHRKDWMEKRPSIIKFGGKTICTMAVTESDGHIEVGQLFILPEYQNRGIGSHLLRRALQKADISNVPVRLVFLQGNRAEALYRRNGFQLIRQTDTHCYMERRPQTITQ